MEEFISANNLHGAFCKRQTDDMKCKVLFPDGTIIPSAKLNRSHTWGPMSHLTITIHEAETVIDSETHLKDLKFKIINKKKE